MKKIIFAFLLVLFIVSCSHASPDRYKIFPDKKGIFGWGSSYIMLDTETGQSWLFSDKRWNPIPKMDEVITGKPDPDELLAKQEEEIKNLKIKQAEQIKALMASQEAEISDLRGRTQPASRSNAKKYSNRVLKRKSVVVKETSSQPDDDEDTGDLPPGWVHGWK